MMCRLPSASSANKTNGALWAAVVASLLLALPACCIPKLCCADKGKPLPDSYNGRVEAENSAQIGWCEFFDDRVLTSLISEAMVGNQELKIRGQDVRIANLEIMARRGAYLPFLSLGSRAMIEKSSRFTRAGAVEDQLTVAPGKGFPDPLPDFLMAADVSWEIDIWRKLRNARDAAVLRYFATREGRTYFVTRLVADVADNYYQLLALDNRLATLNRTIEIQEQSLTMTKEMKAAARGTELAVQRFQAEVQKNQSERYIIQQQIVEVENRINFLLGRFPQPVPRPAVEYIDLNLHALQVGVPSQLLLNRPDIRQAERELAAAGLDVRVARARFYPSLNLHAGVGYRAFNTRYLFDSPESLIYNAAGDLVAPVINRAAIKADYLTANAVQLQAVYEYQQTIINAFVEVINQISKVENYRQSIAIKKQQLSSLEAAVGSATKLFQNARAEYIEVLLAQREMMEAKMRLIETKQEQLSAVVYAYQALGGGGSPTTRFAPNAIVVEGEIPVEEIPLQQPADVAGEKEPPVAPADKKDSPKVEPLPPIKDEPAAGDAKAAADDADSGFELRSPANPLANAG